MWHWALATRFHGGPTETTDGFVDLVRSHAAEVMATMLSRSTQTNEAAPCAAFVPALADVGYEIALIEFVVETGNTLRAPTTLPTVCWRVGLDLNPPDVRDPEDVDWLRACIWPKRELRRPSIPTNGGKAVCHLVRNGDRTIAVTHPHGRWLRWLTPS